jgi:hypothetical protein
MGLLEDRLKAAEAKKVLENANASTKAESINVLNSRVSDNVTRKSRVESAREVTSTLQEMLQTKEIADAQKAVVAANKEVDEGLLKLRDLGEDVPSEEEAQMREEKIQPILQNKEAGLNTISESFFSDIAGAADKITNDLDSERDVIQNILKESSGYSSDDHTRLAEALKTGGLEALHQFHSGREAAKNKEVLEINLKESDLIIEIPDSKYAKLFAYGYKLRNIQIESNALAYKGNELARSLREKGLDKDALMSNPKIIEIAAQLNKMKRSISELQDLHSAEKSRLSAEAKKQAPRNEQEFSSRVQDLEKKYNALDAGSNLNIVLETERLLSNLRKNNARFNVQQDEEYVRISQDSSGRNNSLMQKMKKETDDAFVSFVENEFKKDSKNAELLERFGRVVMKHRFAVLELEQEKKEMINFVLTTSPDFLPWVKAGDREVHQKMWNLVQNNSNLKSWDVGYFDPSIKILAKKFGAAEITDFEPLLS